MSHSVSSSSRAKLEGGFSFECYAFDGSLFRTGKGYKSQPEATKAAEQAEREMIMFAMGGKSTGELSAALAALSDDDLLRELGE